MESDVKYWCSSMSVSDVSEAKFLPVSERRNTLSPFSEDETALALLGDLKLKILRLLCLVSVMFIQTICVSVCGWVLFTCAFGARGRIRVDVRMCAVEFLQGLFLPCFLLPLNVREVIKPIRSVGSQSTDRRTVRGIHFQSAAASTLWHDCVSPNPASLKPCPNIF